MHISKFESAIAAVPAWARLDLFGAREGVLVVSDRLGVSARLGAGVASCLLAIPGFSRLARHFVAEMEL